MLLHIYIYIDKEGNGISFEWKDKDKSAEKILHMLYFWKGYDSRILNDCGWIGDDAHPGVREAPLKHMWLVEWQEMTKCVFCVLCVFVFFYLSKIFWTARVLCVFVFFFRFTTSKFTSQDQYFMCFLCFFYLLIFVIVACVLCVFCVFFLTFF